MANNQKVEWKNVRVPIGKIVRWDENPRYTPIERREKIGKSMDEFGLVEVLVVGPNFELYNGHQRLDVLLQKMDPWAEIEVRQASRELTEQERKKLTVYLHETARGEWDFRAFPDVFEKEDLVEWDFPEIKLNEISWDEEIDLSAFNAAPPIEIMYRFVIDGLSLDDANDYADKFGEGRVEQYRV